MRKRWAKLWRPGLGVVIGIVILVGCGAVGHSRLSASGGAGDAMPEVAAAVLDDGEKLRVVATTSIVADVVAQVAGDRVVLTRLMPLGADPHAFEPTPRDIAAVSEAHIIFSNGVGLETFIEGLLQAAGQDALIVPVSYGIDLLPFEDAHEDAGMRDDAVHEDEHEADPHVWFDPNNVIVWVDNIQTTLVALDPDNAAAYEANATAYLEALEALDEWIRQQVEDVPQERRKLVTDHASLTYFATAYDFEQVGVVIPGASTLAEPSAQHVSALIRTIEAENVPAVFIGRTVNPQLTRQIAGDSGAELVLLYTGSLSDADEPAATYVEFMRYNVNAIAEALR